jgi:subtilisin family serine protease
MRSVLVLLAAVAATVVAGGPAAAENLRNVPSADLAARLRLDPSQNNDRNLKVYIVELAGEPAASYDGGIAGLAKSAPAKGQRYDARSGSAQMYAAHLEAQQNKLLASIGAGSRKLYNYRHALNGFAAKLSPAEAKALQKNKAVRRVWEDQRMRVETNNSPRFLGLLNEEEGLRAKHGLQGQGVIIGIMDSGAIQEHPSFDDTGMPAPPAHWAGECVPGEAWEADDCNNKLIGARYFNAGFDAALDIDPNDFLSARDSDGHGSHTATIAAGREVIASLAGTPLTRISGMAPLAHVAIYKPCWEDLGGDQGASCFFSDSAAATDAAIADGVDILSFSVGTSPSFTDPQDIAFLRAIDAGVFVARSAGNEGPGPGSTAAGEPWVTSVAASTVRGTGFALAGVINSPGSVSGSYPVLEGAITKPLGFSGPVTADFAAAEPIQACEPIAPVTGKIVLIQRGSPVPGGVCTFVQKVEAAVNAGAVAVWMYTNVIDGVENPKVVMGVDPTELTQMIPGVMSDNAIGVQILNVLNSGGTVNGTLSAGSFVTEHLNGNIMADFSSRGPFPTETNWLKPDITAPGVNILAGHTPEPNDGSPGDFFQYLSGTSMSTPHISGLAALVLQEHPDWSPAAVKSAFMTTARQNIVKEDLETRADPFDFGAGHVDPNKAIDPGLVYDAGTLDYLAASCGTVSPLLSPDDCGVVESLGFSLDPANLNLPSIAVGELLGEKTIVRRVTNVNSRSNRYRASVKSPPGFRVTVTPSTLTLEPGETQSFEVTIRNVSAPPGEWRFGRLSWKSGNGNFSVRSPIAVNARLLDAPEEIDGEGADGSAAFDVGFGYTGAYTAGAHGLVEPFLTPFVVSDDPLDSFDFAPGAPDEFIAYLLDLPTGTTYAQWSLFDAYNNDPAHDLDMYLFYCPVDPATGSFLCTQIDQSFNITSNEEVSVQFPVTNGAPADPNDIDDPYLVFIHGFNTVNQADAGGFMFDWTVLGPEGNMTASGPMSAVIGEKGTVNVQWQGLPTGVAEKQVGAVSHNSETGTQGLTIVNIQNDGESGYADICTAAPAFCPL